MTNKTVYTHRGRVYGIKPCTQGKSYTAELRKVGKWWETRYLRRRFDSVGAEGGSNHRHAKYMDWRLDIDSIFRVRTK